MNEHIIQVTDDQGRVADDWAINPRQPDPGSVVLTEGAFGTAWQRYFADGLWHRVGGGLSAGKTWAWMLTKRNVVLVYDAECRETQRPVLALLQPGCEACLMGGAQCHNHKGGA